MRNAIIKNTGVIKIRKLVPVSVKWLKMLEINFKGIETSKKPPD